MALVGTIATIAEIVTEVEKAKGYWDDAGLDMHIAVKKNGQLAVSTKHWTRVHYITTDKMPAEVWGLVKQVTGDIGRTLVKSVKGPYVYINNLNIEQTQAVFDKLKEKLGANIERKWQMSWDINDAVLE